MKYVNRHTHCADFKQIGLSFSMAETLKKQARNMFNFSFQQKLIFYSGYVIYKTFFIWFEVKKPKLKMFVYEMIYSAMKLVDYSSQIPPPFRIDYIESCHTCLHND